MLKDNHKHSEVVKKYDHLHIKPKEQTLVRSPKGTSEKYFSIHSGISRVRVSLNLTLTNISIIRVRLTCKEQWKSVRLHNWTLMHNLCWFMSQLQSNNIIISHQISVSIRPFEFKNQNLPNTLSSSQRFKLLKV